MFAEGKDTYSCSCITKFLLTDTADLIFMQFSPICIPKLNGLILGDICFNRASPFCLLHILPRHFWVGWQHIDLLALFLLFIVFLSDIAHIVLPSARQRGNAILLLLGVRLRVAVFLWLWSDLIWENVLLLLLRVRFRVIALLLLQWDFLRVIALHFLLLLICVSRGLWLLRWHRHVSQDDLWLLPIVVLELFLRPLVHIRVLLVLIGDIAMPSLLRVDGHGGCLLDRAGWWCPCFRCVGLPPARCWPEWVAANLTGRLTKCISPAHRCSKHGSSSCRGLLAKIAFDGLFAVRMIWHLKSCLFVCVLKL